MSECVLQVSLRQEWNREKYLNCSKLNLQCWILVSAIGITQPSQCWQGTELYYEQKTTFR